ncbi:MAG: GlxA family transcriptional regulator [Proteobacteria bacterium]|nr:GlxA family transcriptional regulator [Pseudomonadota bacterium]
MPRLPSHSGPRRIVMAAFPDVQILDVTGPLEVFSGCSRWLQRERLRTEPAYTVELVAERSGPFKASSGIALVAERALQRVRGPIDTLIVPGGIGVDRAADKGKLVSWIARTAPRARRVASVCTGTFLLAEAGLLEGRRVTTHWASCDALAARYPGLRVDPDPIYVKDGPVYTSAGVTAGMDLALALVEEDWGREVALGVARWLVLFLKRPGGQSQFSAQLSSQLADRPTLRELQSWIAEHPDANLSVESLAQRAGMSPRNFARVFTREVGTTPARFVETSRVESARRRLEESPTGVEEVATACGFGSAETMRRAFLRSVRVSPSDYRERFQTH